MEEELIDKQTKPNEVKKKLTNCLTQFLVGTHSAHNNQLSTLTASVHYCYSIVSNIYTLWSDTAPGSSCAASLSDCNGTLRSLGVGVGSRSAAARR